MTAMRCAKCSRPLTKPAGVYAGKVYGPICMQRLGIYTIKVSQPVPSKAERVEVDQLDLFESWSRAAQPSHN